MNNRTKNLILAVLFIGVLATAYTYDVGFVKTRLQKIIENKKYNIQPVLDKSMTNKINDEENIKNGYVYVNSYVVFAPIIVEDDFDVDKVDSLGDKYLRILLKKYTDKEISIKIVNEGGTTLYEKTKRLNEV